MAQDATIRRLSFSWFLSILVFFISHLIMEEQILSLSYLKARSTGGITLHSPGAEVRDAWSASVPAIDVISLGRGLWCVSLTLAPFSSGRLRCRNFIA